MDSIDFSIRINEDRDIRILQITDTQPIDSTQQRYPGRLGENPEDYSYETRYRKMYSHIEKLIRENNPDLILFTGDVVYGEFDDDGSNLLEISKFMDSFGIPWAPVFGNHDNECKLGVSWQCSVFESMKRCLFKRGNLTGNGNYNIGIYRKDKLVQVIYMLDSNGCRLGHDYSYYKADYPQYNLDEHLETRDGIYPDQIEWIKSSSERIDYQEGRRVNKIAAFHIAPDFICEFAYRKGYQSDSKPSNAERYLIGRDVASLDGDSGYKGGSFCSAPMPGLYEALKDHGFTDVFVGHAHMVDASIDCDGVRVTFGVKTGTYDCHFISGGTLITIDKDKEAARFERKILEQTAY